MNSIFKRVQLNVNKILRKLLNLLISKKHSNQNYLTSYLINRKLKKHYPYWNKIFNHDFEEVKKINKNRDKKHKILLATCVGAQTHTVVIENLLATNLSIRNSHVSTVLCDSQLSACFNCLYKPEGTENLTDNYKCITCYSPAQKTFSDLGINIINFSQYITKEKKKEFFTLSKTLKIKEIINYSIGEINIGEHAFAGVLRFFAKSTLDNEKEDFYTNFVIRQYFYSALIVYSIFDKMLDDIKFDCVVFAHGIYVPHGIIGEVCRSKNIRVVNWVPSYRKKTFIFSHSKTYHHTLMNENSELWENVEISPNKLLILENYLHSRWQGKEDWIWFSPNYSSLSKKSLFNSLSLESTKPIIGLLTNVAWDAQLHYPDNIFKNMFDWLEYTIKYFSTRNNLQLVIRVHPAELTGAVPSRQTVIDEIKKRFDSIPTNIKIISPDSPISTYEIMSFSSAVIIYGTKTGVELSTRGIPVIVAGEAWIKNKQISLDPKSKFEYTKILESLDNIDMHHKVDIQRAKKYAFHFFFRRMIPIACIRIESKNYSDFKITELNLNDLKNNSDIGIDVICNGIINASEFIFPEELM